MSNQYWRGALLIILLVLLAIADISLFPAPNYPRAQYGVLDLRQWDFAQNGPTKLNGEWEFYWQELLTPVDARTDVKQYINLPRSWNGYNWQGA